MVKTAFLHKGCLYLHVLIDDQVRSIECPVSWFDQEQGPDGKVNVKVTWPPPYKPGPPPPAGYIDKVTAHETIKIVRSSE